MKALFLHADYFAYQCIKNEKVNALQLEPCYDRAKNVFFDCLVIKICFCNGTSENTLTQLKDEILKFSNNLKCREIVLFPFSHFDSKLLPFKEAKNYYTQLPIMFQNIAQDKTINSHFVPFGFDKEFVLHIKGHPLNVAWREFKEA
jgi:hypothetical protein